MNRPYLKKKSKCETMNNLKNGDNSKVPEKHLLMFNLCQEENAYKCNHKECICHVDNR